MAIDTTYQVGGYGDDEGQKWRKLDIEPEIIDQDPRDTPLFEITTDSRHIARDVMHSWQVRGIAARASNAQLEGDDYTYDSVLAPDRVTNNTQIMWQNVRVSGTAQAIEYHGVSDLIMDQVRRVKAPEMRGDMELALIRGSLSDGDGSTARTLDGIIAATSTNSTTCDSLTEGAFIGFLRLPWLQGAKVRDVLVPSSLQNVVNQFDAQTATRWVDITTREIVHMVLVYHSSFGTVQFHMSRDLYDAGETTSNDVGEMVGFDRDMVHKVYLQNRRPQLEAPAKVGDYWSAVMLTELTFQYDNEQALVYFNEIATPDFT